MFNYKPLDEKDAPRGTIGIPRVLNMYEDYPFWFTFFTSLGFRVIISEKSNRKTYEKGMESMPSESVCYPAKLSHGHIISLIQSGIKTIFYPCMPYSRKEYEKADNHYNCPIVISYSEVLKNNVEELKNPDIKFLNPFLPFDAKNLTKRILELDEFKEYNFNKKELMEAAKKAEEEYQNFKNDICKKGKEKSPRIRHFPVFTFVSAMFTTRNIRNILSFRLSGKSCKRFFASLPKVAKVGRYDIPYHAAAYRFLYFLISDFVKVGNLALENIFMASVWSILWICK